MNFGVTRTLPELYRASAAPNVANVPSTACRTIGWRADRRLQVIEFWNRKLIPPRNTPSATV